MIDLEKRKAYQKQWQKDNRERRNASMKKYRATNPDKVKDSQKRQSIRKKVIGFYKTDKYKTAKKQYRDTDTSKNYMSDYQKKYRETEKSIAYESSPQRRISTATRSKIRKAIKYAKKSIVVEQLTGITFKELKVYLENKFDDKMNWSNYGSYWHIDHIRPCVTFDLTKEDEVKKCFHYTNLQPLDAKTNMSKGRKLWS